MESRYELNSVGSVVGRVGSEKRHVGFRSR